MIIDSSFINKIVLIRYIGEDFDIEKPVYVLRVSDSDLLVKDLSLFKKQFIPQSKISNIRIIPIGSVKNMILAYCDMNHIKATKFLVDYFFMNNNKE